MKNNLNCDKGEHELDFKFNGDPIKWIGFKSHVHIL